MKAALFLLAYLVVFASQISSGLSMPSTVPAFLWSPHYHQLLQNNQLSGPIPAEIGRLLLLETLDLSGNQFSGNIPSSLGFLTHLSYLRLNRNKLVGQISSLVADLQGLSFFGPTPKILAKGFSVTGNSFLCNPSSPDSTRICMDVSKPVNDTGSPPKVSGHRRWVLSVALGITCTFVISVVLLVCWVHWYRFRLLFTSYGTIFLKMDVAGNSSGVKFESLLFDLDDTLYPMSSGLNLACRKNIEEYMLQNLDIEESEVPRICLELYREHGTTMAGLKALGHEFDDDEFHAYVHGRLPYDALQPDLVLRNLLLSMPQRKIIFTNADKAHAAEVLSRLCLEDCFEGIICFETLNPPRLLPDDEVIEGTTQATATDCIGNNISLKSSILCKPSVEAIEAAIRIANVDPKKTIFFDDSTRNIASGKAAGLHTVIVGTSELVPGADYALRSIHNIREAIPEIWEGEEGQHLEQFIQSTAVETVVRA